MTPIEDALKLTDPDDIVREIVARKKLRGQMVGQLYPGVLAEEIDALVARFDEVGGVGLEDALYHHSRQP